MRAIIKYCAKCDKEKHFYEFGVKQKSFDGLQPYCKECMAKHRKALSDKDPLKVNKFKSKKTLNLKWKQKNGL